MTALSAASLSKTYTSGIFQKRRVHALHDLTLTVEPGQIFSLLGPNGAGKTTFIKILLSLTAPSSGSASLLGKEIPDVGVRARIGYLPENHRYPGYLTGDQVLGLFGRLGGVSGTTLAARIPKLMELVGMAQWRTMKIKRYSKGMLQRLGLAQALINDPDVLFLDEPTDGVDPVGRKEIRDVLHHLKSQGKTIFLNSHLLSEVELVSDRVAILDKGKLIRLGTVDELTTTGDSHLIGIEGALNGGAQTELAALAFKAEVSDKGLTVDVRSTGDLNRVIDLLRRNNISILSIARVRSSLEDSFINLLKKESAS